MLLGFLGLLHHLSRHSDHPIEAGIDLAEALSDENGEFAVVTPGRKFKFPADHGAHPEFKTEWWYFTGNLSTVEGRKFGYQLTLFRVRLLPGGNGDRRLSEWDADFVMMAHFALSDPQSGTFQDFERFSRCALGLAGFLPDARKIWLEDWEIRRGVDGWTLQAAQDRLSLSLRLTDLKPPILQGEDGYSRKGPEPRHASYYVSQTRLQTEGRLNLNGETFQVSGSSWFDHEWSSEAMAQGLVGWDWFSLQLSDQTELMVYFLRRDDGTIEPASSGAVIGLDGRKRNLKLSEIKVEVLERRTARSGRIYPGKWRLEIPTETLTLTVSPTLPDQEMTTGVTYWEGAVEVSGSRGTEALEGVGFVELTGY